MAFEITKSTIYRMTAKMGCGCYMVQEFDTPQCDTPSGEGVYTGCAKHEGKEGGEIISTILGEFLDTEAKREGTKSFTKQVAPGTEVDEHGNVISKVEVPGKIKPLHRRPVLSTAAMPPQRPEVIDPGDSGDEMDALLASEDPSENRTTVTPTRTSKS